MGRWFSILLIGLCACGAVRGSAPAGAAVVEAAPAWVIWLDGTDFVPEWSQALQAVLQVIQPGETAILVVSGSAYRFVRQNDASQLESLVSAIRPKLEMGAHRFTQLGDEMAKNAGGIAADESTKSQIAGYIQNRKLLLDLYGEAQLSFWKALDEGIVPAGARLVVLVQQFDVPAVDRGVLQAMQNDARMREWVLNLQETAPLEEKTKTIKRIAGRLQAQKSRVDGFYLRQKNASSRSGVEVSKAFFSGVTRLSKASGGVSQYLKASADEIVSALRR